MENVGTTDGRPYEDIDATLTCRGGSEAAVYLRLPLEGKLLRSR